MDRYCHSSLYSLVIYVKCFMKIHYFAIIDNVMLMSLNDYQSSCEHGSNLVAVSHRYQLGCTCSK